MAILQSAPVEPVSAEELEIVVPNAFADTEAGRGNRYPFDLDGMHPSMRHQQVYGASEFSALAGPGMVFEIAFRPDREKGSAFSETFADFEIHLSTTTQEPGALSATFAENVGPDDTVVFAGALALSSSYTGPAEGPKDFDIVIALQTPFLYDPVEGNLLLDIRNFDGSISTTSIDADADPFGSISRVFTGENDTDVDDTVGTATDQGLITLFTVPEASSRLLQICAILTVALAARLRRSAGRPKAAV